MATARCRRPEPPPCSPDRRWAVPLNVRPAIAGVGLTIGYGRRVRPHIDAGELVAVLEEYCEAFPGFFLYFSRRRHRSAALQALIEACAREGSGVDSRRTRPPLRGQRRSGLASVQRPGRSGAGRERGAPDVDPRWRSFFSAHNGSPRRDRFLPSPEAA